MKDAWKQFTISLKVS